MWRVWSSPESECTPGTPRNRPWTVGNREGEGEGERERKGEREREREGEGEREREREGGGGGIKSVMDCKQQRERMISAMNISGRVRMRCGLQVKQKEIVRILAVGCR